MIKIPTLAIFGPVGANKLAVALKLADGAGRRHIVRLRDVRNHDFEIKSVDTLVVNQVYADLPAHPNRLALLQEKIAATGVRIGKVILVVTAKNEVCARHVARSFSHSINYIHVNHERLKAIRDSIERARAPQECRDGHHDAARQTGCGGVGVVADGP